MLEVNVKLDGFSRIDFDKRKIRKTMQVLGRDVQKEARWLVSRRLISGAGEFPGRDTGALWRAIKYKVSKPGFLVRIQPDKTAEMGPDFYPAFLQYGVRKNRIAKLAKQHKRQPDGPYRLEPRGNYMIRALDSRRDMVRSMLRNTLQNSLIPRK